MDLPVFSVTLATSKRCLRCGGLMHLSDFPTDKSKLDGKSIYCSNCISKINKLRRSKPEYKVKRRKNSHKYIRANREWRLKNKYGMTLSQFDSMFELQGRVCALCKSDKSDNKNFVVDHCHKTGRVRGILCSYCNRALGMLRDDVTILKKAIEYIGE